MDRVNTYIRTLYWIFFWDSCLIKSLIQKNYDYSHVLLELQQFFLKERKKLEIKSIFLLYCSAQTQIKFYQHSLICWSYALEKFWEAFWFVQKWCQGRRGAWIRGEKCLKSNGLLKFNHSFIDGTLKSASSYLFVNKTTIKYQNSFVIIDIHLSSRPLMPI